MSDRASDPGGVPPSIAAIMAAIRAEVAAPREPVPPAAVDVPRAVLPVLPPEPRPPRAGAAAVPLPASLDEEARVLLAPLLRDWLDAHLPEIVEAAVHAELRRLTGQP